MKRDSRIDILRAIAILLIMLAHVKPPEPIQQIRVFDVPLMAILLGMSFLLSSRASTYFDYVIKRFKRLIIPAWVFLTIFFSLTLLTCIILKAAFPYKLATILTSYSLISGIGYVWIIRVFFTIAIFSPLIYWISVRITTFFARSATILIAMIIQQVLWIIDSNISNIYFSLIFEQLIAISFGYLICALYGIWLYQYSKTMQIYSILIYSVPMAILMIVEHLPNLADQKYPPSMLFLLYGIIVSNVLFLFVSIVNIDSILFSWISRYSLELYYWHILPVTFIDFTYPNMEWYWKLIIIILFSFSVTFLQVKKLPRLFTL